jgi:predicted KAP-like P-loop ATPase
LVNPKAETSPPKEIQALRTTFEETLDELGVTLVVLIDDLDRCLPETTISTLEAVRLFLFLKNTAFVIAADNDMIKHAVRKHFEGVDDDVLVTNYFDKLIQVPIRVPPLGTQEVRSYLMLLFIENSSLEDGVKEKMRAGICGQLQQTWSGKRVDRAFVQTLHHGLPSDLLSKFDTAERLAPLMTTASGMGSYPPMYQVGDKITVLYIPNKPSDAAIDNFFDTWGIPLVAGGLGAIQLTIGLTVWFWPWIVGRFTNWQKTAPISN